MCCLAARRSPASATHRWVRQVTWRARPGVTSWASVAGLRPGSRLLPVCAGCTEIRHHFSSTTRPRSRATPVSLCSSRGVMKVSTAELGVVGNSTPPPPHPQPPHPHTQTAASSFHRIPTTAGNSLTTKLTLTSVLLTLTIRHVFVSYRDHSIIPGRALLALKERHY